MLIVLIYCAALCFGWMPESQKRRMNFIKDVRFFTRFSGLPTNLVSSFPLPKPMEVTLLSNVPTFPRIGRPLRATHKVLKNTIICEQRLKSDNWSVYLHKNCRCYSFFLHKDFCRVMSSHPQRDSYFKL